MKQTNGIKTNWIYLVPLLAQWAMYLLLIKKLPAQIATHFTIENGKWVPNDYTAPFWLMIIMTVVYGVVYVSLNRKYLATAKLSLFIPVIRVVALVFLSLVNIKLLWDGAHPAGGYGQGGYGELVLLLVLMNGFTFYVFRYQMGKEEERPLSDTYFHLVWAISHLAITLAIGIPLLGLAGIPVFEGKGLNLFILAFLAVIGNITYNVKPNFFIGIRLPWTLNNPQVWRKTHHVMGVMLLVAAVVGIILTWTLPEDSPVQRVIMPAVVITGVVIPAVYSFIISRDQKTNNYTA